MDPVSQSSDESVATRHAEILDTTAVVILSATTVLTAWSAFQAAKWGGEEAEAYVAASSSHKESVRHSVQAGQQVLIDLTAFTSWVNAVATENESLAEFYRARFRDEFEPAIEAWLAAEPLTNPDAPPTPFAMDAYRLATNVRSLEYMEETEALLVDAYEYGNRSDNYLAMTILFAAVLFFAGINTKFDSLRNRSFIVLLAVLGLVGGIIWLLTFPAIF